MTKRDVVGSASCSDVIRLDGYRLATSRVFFFNGGVEGSGSRVENT